MSYTVHFTGGTLDRKTTLVDQLGWYFHKAVPSQDGTWQQEHYEYVAVNLQSREVWAEFRNVS